MRTSPPRSTTVSQAAAAATVIYLEVSCGHRNEGLGHRSRCGALECSLCIRTTLRHCSKMLALEALAPYRYGAWEAEFLAGGFG